MRTQRTANASFLSALLMAGFTAPGVVGQDDQVQLVVQTGHADEVDVTAISPDGTQVASADADVLLLWDTPSQRQIGRVKLRYRFPDHLEYVLGGSAVLVESSSGFELISTIDMRSATARGRAEPRLRKDDKRLLRDTEGDDVHHMAIARNSRWLAIATVVDGRCTVDALQSATGERWQVPVRHRFVSRLVFSPSGRYLAVAGSSAVDVFDMNSGAPVGHAPIEKHDLDRLWLPAYRIRFSPDDRMLAVMSSDASDESHAARSRLRRGRPDPERKRTLRPETIRVYDLQQRERPTALARLFEVQGGHSFEFTTTGSALRIVRDDRLVEHELATATDRVLVESSETIWASAIAAKADRFVTGFQQGEFAAAVHGARLYETETGAALASLAANPVRFQEVVLDHTTGRLFANSLTGLWELDVGKGRAQRLRDGFSRLLGVTDGRPVGLHSARGRVFFESMESDERSWVDVMESDGYVHMSWVDVADRYDRVAAAAGERLVVREFPAGDVVADIQRDVPDDGEDHGVNKIALDKTGDLVALLDDAGTLTVYEVATRTAVGTLTDLRPGLWTGLRSFTTGSWLLATGREVLAIELVATDNARELRRRTVAEGSYSYVSVAPAGDMAILQGDDGSQLLTLPDGSLQPVAAVTGQRQAAFTADGSRVIGVAADGTLSVHDTNNGEARVTVCCTGDADSVWFTPDGSYQATREALSLLSFRRGLDVYGVEQFDAVLNRPDRVRAALGAPPSVTRGLAAMHQRRLARLGLDDTTTSLGAPPTLRFTTSPTARTAEPEVSVELTATAGDSPITAVQVAVDGVPLFAPPGRPWQPSETTASVAVPLARGASTIEVWGQDSKGRRSLPLRHRVTCSAPGREPRVFLVGFGVGGYAHARNLPFAAKDVRDLATMLERTFGERMQVRTFRDREVGNETLRDARELLETADVTDIVIAHFAGHGLRDAEGNYWFATHDTDFASPQKGGIAFEQVMQLVSGLRARQRLVLLDTCHAGEFEQPRQRGANRTQPSSAGEEGPSTRGGPEPETKPRTLPLLEEFFVDVRRETGAFVLAAASGESAAIEADGNGYFTKAVIEGLTWAAADRDGDQKLTVRELQTFVSQRVPKISDGRQRPVILRENLDAEFALVAARRPRVLSPTPKFARGAGYASLQQTAVSSDGSRLLALTNRVLRVVDLASGDALIERRIGSSEAGPNQAAMSPDGSTVLLRLPDAPAQWIDVATGRDWPIAAAGLQQAASIADLFCGPEGPLLVVPRTAAEERDLMDVVKLRPDGNELSETETRGSWQVPTRPRRTAVGLAALGSQRFVQDAPDGNAFRPVVELLHFDPAAIRYEKLRELPAPLTHRQGLRTLRMSRNGKFVGLLTQHRADDKNQSTAWRVTVWNSATGAVLFDRDVPAGDVAVTTEDGGLYWLNLAIAREDQPVEIVVLDAAGKVLRQHRRHAFDQTFAVGDDGAIGISNARRLNPFGTERRRLDVRILQASSGEVWLGAPAGIAIHVFAVTGAVFGVLPEGTVVTWGTL